MYKIAVEGHFSAAHFLEDYKGLCGSVHGHRWNVVLRVKQDVNKDTSMVVDFTDLKKSINTIMDEMDHSFILDTKGNQVSKDLAEVLKKYNMRIYDFRGRTTAENIAKHIYSRIKEMTGWTTHSVEVFEAPTNSVVYEEE